MPDEKVKLPRSSFDELCKVIRAYGHLGKPAGATEVSKAAGLSKVLISANNKFLLATGIIEGGKKKNTTTKGANLAGAIEHQMPGELRRYWREIVASSDFLSRLVSAVRIRNGMDAETLESHIAYSAGEPNKGFVMTGARAVIDLLRATELIREEDGKFTAVDVVSKPLSDVIDGPSKGIKAVVGQMTKVATADDIERSLSPVLLKRGTPAIQFNINI